MQSGVAVRALIIDDEALIAIVIEDHLASLGYEEVLIATAERAAVAAAQVNYPNVVKADVRLTSGCGIAAALTIAEQITVPVVFVTGSAAQVHKRVREPIIVQKPFVVEILAAKVARAGAAPGLRPAPEGI